MTVEQLKYITNVQNVLFKLLRRAQRAIRSKKAQRSICRSRRLAIWSALLRTTRAARTFECRIVTPCWPNCWWTRSAATRRRLWYPFLSIHVNDDQIKPLSVFFVCCCCCRLQPLVRRTSTTTSRWARCAMPTEPSKSRPRRWWTRTPLRSSSPTSRRRTPGSRRCSSRAKWTRPWWPPLAPTATRPKQKVTSFPFLQLAFVFGVIEEFSNRIIEADEALKRQLEENDKSMKAMQQSYEEKLANAKAEVFVE